MSVVWPLVACVLVLIWVLSIVDIIRQHYPGRTTAGWILLVVILPVVGSLIYAFTRGPAPDATEQRRLAEADQRHSAASRPFDSTGMGP